MSEQPEPTERDRDNAHFRQEVAERQNRAYAEAMKLALDTLGPGWIPWMKLVLIDSDHRRSGNTEPVATVYKVCRGDHRRTEQAVFLRPMPDGKVQQADNPDALFGDLLTEKHPTQTFEFKAQRVACPRWTLYWSALELYAPKSAAELALLRVRREQGKEERADKQWANEHPLLAQADITRQDLEPEEKERGR